MFASPLFLLGIGLIVASVWMILFWFIARVIANYGIVDVAWSFGFIVITGLYVAISGAPTDKSLILLAMVCLWSLRLGFHLLSRFLRWHPNEDPRYSELKKQMGAQVEEKMLLIYLWQGVILVTMTAPMAVTISNKIAGLNWFNYIGTGLWALGLLGEGLADRQLERFVRDPSNKGKTCQLGLWRYSRHPNYFFEWLISLAFFIYALSSPYGIFSVVAPAVLLYLIVNVTGVKPSEEHSMKTREDYAEYKRVTSPFVPWFRRS